VDTGLRTLSAEWNSLFNRTIKNNFERRLNFDNHHGYTTIIFILVHLSRNGENGNNKN